VPQKPRRETLYPLRLIPQEQQLLLNMQSLRPGYDKPLKALRTTKGELVAMFTYGQLDVLLGSVAYECNHTKDRKYDMALEPLFLRISKLVEQGRQELLAELGHKEE